MTLLATYFAQKSDLIPDQAQLKVLHELQAIEDALIQEKKIRKRFGLLRKPKLIAGMYLWGGVGIGKTYLLDCFYHSLPFHHKKRMHFFAFMRFIHLELKKQSGKKNPLMVIAKELAKNIQVLCLDEFFVKDIVDAMLLGQLLRSLFLSGITVVTTSNIAPDQLYERGLQREQFLPAIQLIKKNLKVIQLENQTDYRKQHAENINLATFDARIEANLATLFKQLAGNNETSDTPIQIADRTIKTNKHTNEMVWFDFKEICSPPRSQTDYLAITSQYKIVFLSHIPAIASNHKNTIRLFISMIDIFYDAKIKLFFSTTVPLTQIYFAGDMVFEFTRTLSRLIEMQTKAYGSITFD